MAKRPRFEVRVTGPARRDIATILNWSRKEFGEAAALRYQVLIVQALQDIGDDPERPSSKERPQIMIKGVRTYHLEYSRSRVSSQSVKVAQAFSSLSPPR